MQKFKDRIIGMKRIKPSDIIPHPMNHKEHSEEQRIRMRSILQEVGFAGAVIVRKHKGKYQLIGGHMRREEMKQPIPAIILDVTEREGTEIMGMLDAIADMADADENAIQLLTQSFTAGTEEFQTTLDMLCPALALPAFDGGGKFDDDLEPGAPPEPLDAPQVRCVPLVFTAKQKAEFIKLVTKLNATYGTDNYSDTVIRAFKEWNKTHGKAKQRSR